MGLLVVLRCRISRTLRRSESARRGLTRSSGRRICRTALRDIVCLEMCERLPRDTRPGSWTATIQLGGTGGVSRPARARSPSAAHTAHLWVSRVALTRSVVGIERRLARQRTYCLQAMGSRSCGQAERRIPHRSSRPPRCRARSASISFEAHRRPLSLFAWLGPAIAQIVGAQHDDRARHARLAQDVSVKPLQAAVAAQVV